MTKKSKQVESLEAIILTQHVENSRLSAELYRLARLLPAVPPRGWLRPKQVADELGVSVPRVTQLIAQGQLRAEYVGRDVYIDPASPRLKRGSCFKPRQRRNVRS